MRLFIPVFLVVLLSACVPHRGLRSKSFVPSGEQSKITFRVPDGYEDELINMDTTGGKAQYYTYPYGAIFYIYYNASEVPALQQEQDSGSKASLPPSREGIRDGTDESGFYWKEVTLEKYRFGYRYVPVNMLSQFDRAIHSVRIKKG